MCEYFKDDGEQCGIDSHDGAFCHLHEDSEQAEAIERSNKGVSGDFLDKDDPGICPECEEPVRRAVASVKEAKFQPKQVVIEEEFRCGCGGVTTGTRQFPKSDVPDGWYGPS